MSELHADLLRANQHVDLLEQPKEPELVLTLRDQFAMAALTGIADQLPYSIDNRKELVRNLAIGAYQIADAMLEAREAK